MGVSLLPSGFRPTWLEIDLDSIVHNIQQFQRLLGPRVKIAAVVKADGYGHGAVEVSRAAVAAGASYLMVAFLEEGVELRQAGIDAPILLLGYTDPAQVPALCRYNLIPSVFDLEVAHRMSAELVRQGSELPVHIKVDTGMGRLGILPGGAAEFITGVSRLPGLKLEGVYTHLAAADEEDPEFTENQLQQFNRVIECCRNHGISPSFYHAANSAAASAYPGSRFNLVRLGLSLYGYYPSVVLRGKNFISLKPALSFKSRVVYLKEVPPGTAISYGCTHVASARSLIATVPVGYGDGYRWALSNRARVLLRGRRVPVVGRVCMDHLMLDLTGVEGAQVGDEVVLYGRQGPAEVTLEEVAGWLGTLNYELLCAISRRVPRLYLRHGEPAAIRGSLGLKII
ncbi:MAG: alanine racemase [Firmicutes bacterium]|nr:alanine racemase [Bacillota bacterium]